MRFSSLVRFLRPLSRRTGPRPTTWHKPCAEVLEDRCLPSTYSITDLGTLGGSSSSAYAISPAGQVVGNSATSTNAAGDAFLWQNGAMTDLGTLGGTGSTATGINGLGQIVGSAGTSASGDSHAFLWQNGGMTDLGTLGGSSSAANAINASGQVVGSAATAGSATHAFLWQYNTGMTDLGVPRGDTTSYAYGVNSSGVVVGDAITSQSFYQAILWQNGRPSAVAGLGFQNNLASAINDSGQIAGSSYTVVTHKPTSYYSNTYITESGAAFISQNGKVTNLPPLPGYSEQAFAAGINASGQVVGTAVHWNVVINYRSHLAYVFRTTHPFVWQNGAGISDLNNLIPTGSGWNLTYAEDVNDSGQIVGLGTINGVTHGFLLTPAKGPGALQPAIVSPTVLPGPTATAGVGIAALRAVPDAPPLLSSASIDLDTSLGGGNAQGQVIDTSTLAGDNSPASWQAGATSGKSVDHVFAGGEGSLADLRLGALGLA